LELGLDGVVLKVDNMDEVIKLKVFLSQFFSKVSLVFTKPLPVYNGHAALLTNTSNVSYAYERLLPVTAYFFIWLHDLPNVCFLSPFNDSGLF
jgi:hypothetical protein